MKYFFSVLVILTGYIAEAQSSKNIDLLIFNAKVYTVDAKFSVETAIAIKNGKIVEAGNTKSLEKKYKAATRYNAEGKTIIPGIIDAHAHFFGYASGLMQANLVGTKSWDEVLHTLDSFRKEKKIAAGEWITGRGWDQNDWELKDFPTKQKLDEVFPSNPVYITRIDGHAAIANQKALDMAGVRAGQTLTGGQIEVKNGSLTGVLVDNATDLVSDKIPAANLAKTKAALQEAEKNCFAVGLTTIDDCGLDKDQILLLKKLQDNGDIKMRVFAMLSDTKKNYAFAFSNGKIKTPRLNVSSFKVYADGALGSRGACLLEPYTDKPDWTGFLLSSQKHFDSVASILYANHWQMCTHAIGDSGNRTILNIYAKYLKTKNDRRWRIEHAQVVNKNDFALFGNYSIIPSVQPTHATSDMYWAEKRLGSDRVKGAYAYKQLMQQNKWIPLGTDFPVEDISPFKTFYAAVVRKDAAGWPENGYQVENALTRQEALKGMTIWAAMSNFEEKEKGSIEKGKYADLVILDQDIMTTPPEQLLKIKVLATFVNGEKLYCR
jgi:predicted amidohydrolase YtcJ